MTEVSSFSNVMYFSAETQCVCVWKNNVKYSQIKSTLLIMVLEMEIDVLDRGSTLNTMVLNLQGYILNICNEGRIFIWNNFI